MCLTVRPGFGSWATVASVPVSHSDWLLGLVALEEVVVVLAVVSVSEQRLLAVREVLDAGASVTDVAVRYGVDRRTVHRWLVRYANEGMAGLVDHEPPPLLRTRTVWCLRAPRMEEECLLRSRPSFGDVLSSWPVRA